jgi:hypothetical protein
MAIDARGSTFQIVHDPESNKLITIYPSGARSTKTLSSGANLEQEIAKKQSHISQHYSNVGSVALKTEQGAHARLSAEFEAANAAARARAAAAGPPIPPKLTVKSEYSQYVGQREGRVVDGIKIPKWVDDDYLSSYVTSVKNGKPRAPNSRELTELQAGVPIEQLYGTMSSSEWQKYTRSTSSMTSTGRTADTRDWNKILNKAIDPVTGEYDNKRLIAAAGAAKAQLFGGISIKNVNGRLFYVGGNGTVLTSVHSSFDKAMRDSMYYGITDFSGIQQEASNAVEYSNNQIASLTTQLASATTPQQKQAIQDKIDAYSTGLLGLNSIQKSFTPDIIEAIKPFFNNQSDVFEDTYVPAVASRVESPSTEEQTDDMLGVVEQTIVAPEVVVPGTTTVGTPQPDYTGTTPSAEESLPTTQQPVSTTPYTPTPTTVTGQPVAVGVTPTGVYPQAPVTGTMSTPLQTAGLSAVPRTVQVRDNYTGTTMSNLTSQSQKGFGGQRTYENQFGQRITITVDAQGNPLTYKPPGYDKIVTGMAEGGDTGSRENEALYTIAKMNGYNGPKSGTALKAFFNSSDALKAKARAIGVAMNKGGAVLYAAPGTDVSAGSDSEEDNEESTVEGINAQPGTSIDPSFATQLAGQTKDLIGQTMTPQQSVVDYIQPQEADFIGQTAGQTTAVAPMAEAAQVGTVQQAQMPMTTAASTMTPTTSAAGVQAETDALQAQTGTLSAGAQVDAQQQLTTSVSGMEVAQGTATMVDAPAAREIEDGELIDVANDITGQAQKAAQFNEQIQAATATPTKQATVAGQLEGLMQQFEGGNTPAWAAGSMRTAMQTLAARGLGASSLAGQAVIQAAMEAALPIAQMDAQTTAQFEAQNLSNRQQRAMLAAQQRAQFLGQEFDQAFQARVQNSARIGDIANMNFTAEQNIALENSRAANTMNLTNLSNRQAMVMAEAAALANLDMANLNNRQQAAVQNAQNFLQMDMANLNNEQQTAMFKAQQNIQALFTDQAAENAAAQFNAQSENQTNQFFANLSAQTSQFNAAQQNAMDQFNVNSVNALREFNSEIQQQRDMFNAQNGLVVAQANAQWRQNIATLNSAAQNESNMNFAKTMNAFTSTNLDAYWQRERDVMSFAFTSAENAADRLASVLLEKLSADNKTALADAQGKGTLGAVLLKGALNYMATGGGKTVV